MPKEEAMNMGPYDMPAAEPTNKTGSGALLTDVCTESPEPTVHKLPENFSRPAIKQRYPSRRN